MFLQELSSHSYKLTWWFLADKSCQLISCSGVFCLMNTAKFILLTVQFYGNAYNGMQLHETVMQLLVSHMLGPWNILNLVNSCLYWLPSTLSTSKCQNLLWSAAPDFGLLCQNFHQTQADCH